MKHRARHELRRRLERLEGPNVGTPLGLRDASGEHVTDWLSGDEFEELADLLRSGLSVEARACQRLLAFAWQRYARGEPTTHMWRVRIEEGRPTAIPRDDGRGLYHWP
jgi:hypothetical protein